MMKMEREENKVENSKWTQIPRSDENPQTKPVWGQTLEDEHGSKGWIKENNASCIREGTRAHHKPA